MGEQDKFEALPENILLSKDFIISSVIDETKRTKQINKKEKSRNSTINAAVTSISLAVTLISGWNSIPESFWIIRYIAGLVVGGYFIYSIISGVNWHDAHKSLKELPKSKNDLKNEIAYRINRTMKRTAIIIIAYRDKNVKEHSNQGVLKFLTREDTFLSHVEMMPDKGIEEQKEVIQGELLDEYNINQQDILKITEIENDFLYSIKPVHGKMEMNAFAFYVVRLNASVKSRLLGNSGIKWMTLEEMHDDPYAMSVNKDVIDYLLAHKFAIKDSFIDFVDDVRVIWNITNKCSFNCAICATHDEKRVELNAADKLKVLNSIYSAISRINSIDFAGGDPCCSSDSMDIIENAIQLFGTERVSVTTTGKGIEQLREDSCARLLSQCEITIDASHENLREDNIFSREEYCKLNIEKVQERSENLRKLIINIPLLADDLNDSEIQCLIERVAALKRKNPRLEIETLLIRLMPVGSLAENQSKEQYMSYNPLELAQKIKEKFKSVDIPCRYHCSLRVLMGMHECDKWCEMLEHKIGIDCAGNVFACAWGSYIGGYDDIKNNPFYLGNLTETRLADILDGKKRTQAYRDIHREIENGVKRHYCSVISRYVSNELFEDMDPLSKGCQS